MDQNEYFESTKTKINKNQNYETKVVFRPNNN